MRLIQACDCWSVHCKHNPPPQAPKECGCLWLAIGAVLLALAMLPFISDADAQTPVPTPSPTPTATATPKPSGFIKTFEAIEAERKAGNPLRMEPDGVFQWCDSFACCTSKNTCNTTGCTKNTPICCPKTHSLLRYDFNNHTWLCIRLPSPLTEGSPSP